MLAALHQCLCAGFWVACGLHAYEIGCTHTPHHAPLPSPYLLAPADGFLGAIETSGGFGDPFLFGLLPVIMAWRQRYSSGQQEEEGEGKKMRAEMVPGGKAGLAGLGKCFCVRACLLAWVGACLCACLPWMCRPRRPR